MLALLSQIQLHLFKVKQAQIPSTQKQQIRAVIYGDDIRHYAEKLQLFNRFLVSTARVKVSPSIYGRPIHKFHWVIDKETIVEHVKPTAQLDIALPPLTKLNTMPFDQVRQMTPSLGVETGLQSMLVVLRQDVARENQLLLTLWDDFDDIEGSGVESKLKGTNKLPVLIGRNIGLSPYQGLTLQMRFNSTICLNPPYPQALQLMDWAQANQQRLSARIMAHAPTSTTAIAMPPDAHSVITIAQLTAEALVGVFHIEVEMSIPDDLQKFCVLECSGCKQKKCTKELSDLIAPNAKRRPHGCLDLTDGSGSTTALILGDLAEKLIAMPAVYIFQTTCAKLPFAVYSGNSWTLNTHKTCSVISYSMSN